jgi:hypothetical protein
MSEDTPQSSTETETPRQFDSNDILCKFYDANTGSSDKKCQGKASGFVRLTHSNRLCPLCDPCKAMFVKANHDMSEESRKTIPGGGAFTEVILEDGRDEFVKQVPRTPQTP